MRALVASMQQDHPAKPSVIVSNDETSGGIAWARAQGLPTEVIDHRPFGADRTRFEAALDTALEPYDIDLICLAGFMRVLTAGFVGPRKGAMLNIHPSLLPKYRGLNTHARAIAAGDSEHGCTVHEVTAELDDGPILGQSVVPILPDDSADTLAARVLSREHVLYPEVLKRFVMGERTRIML